jgi:hypothetical protein
MDDSPSGGRCTNYYIQDSCQHPVAFQTAVFVNFLYGRALGADVRTEQFPLSSVQKLNMCQAPMQGIELTRALVKSGTSQL